MFPNPVSLATVTMSGCLAVLPICTTAAGFRRLLFLSTLVFFAFVLFKDDSSFSELQAAELQVS